MRVSEIFYSLQGEGGRAGDASVFVRLQGCTAKHACATSGVVCDTEFESGAEMSVPLLAIQMAKAVDRVVGDEGQREVMPWVVWTGGEPLDQLTPEILKEMRELGWERHALETSGVKPMSQDLAAELDWITISPKVAEHILVKHFPWTQGRPVEELRYVRHAGQPGVPQPSLLARNYYLSPHSDGLAINMDNVRHCVRLCLQYPQWRVSVQQHKVWAVL